MRMYQAVYVDTADALPRIHLKQREKVLSKFYQQCYTQISTQIAVPYPISVKNKNEKSKG
jgi:hypothetical protein